MADPQIWLDALRDVGFPIIVAVYVLVRLDRTMMALAREIRTLTHHCAACAGHEHTRLDGSHREP